MSARLDGLKAWFAEFLAKPITPRVLQQTYSFLRVGEHVKTAAVSKECVRKETGSIIKTGYLVKLGGNKQHSQGFGPSWKRRFMVLSDDLVYYESEEKYEEGAAPKNKVSMNATYCPTPKPNDKNEFTLYALPYEFTVQASSKEEMDEWVHGAGSTEMSPRSWGHGAEFTELSPRS